jgi:uncharacterized membrane protein
MSQVIILLHLAALGIFILGWAAIMYHLYRYGLVKQKELVHILAAFFGIVSLGLIIWSTLLLLALI